MFEKALPGLKTEKFCEIYVTEQFLNDFGWFI